MCPATDPDAYWRIDCDGRQRIAPPTQVIRRGTVHCEFLLPAGTARATVARPPFHPQETPETSGPVGQAGCSPIASSAFPVAHRRRERHLPACRNTKPLAQTAEDLVPMHEALVQTGAGVNLQSRRFPMPAACHPAELSSPLRRHLSSAQTNSARVTLAPSHHLAC